MKHRRIITALITLWLMCSSTAIVTAEPTRPTDDTEVLERLTVKATDPISRELRTLRQRLRGEPQNLELAAQLATRYIEQGRADGDPRFLGQAQAVLGPWWDEPSPPPAVLLLRATIRQNAHEFDRALADLDQVLAIQPFNAQAWLSKASILQVQSRYKEARQACQRLHHIAARHITLACLADIEGLTGHAAKSQELLTATLIHSTISERERIWILTILGELAARVGNTQAAQQSYTDALRIGVKDQYLLSAYADFLLDQGRYREVLSLLQSETKADGLLLRLTLAEQALHFPTAAPHTAELAARFAASRGRGTSVHLREEARFTLELLHDPQTALALAQANWKVQKEPWDARLLLENAVATGHTSAARPVIEWLTTNHVDDARLKELARLIGEKS